MVGEITKSLKGPPILGFDQGSMDQLWHPQLPLRIAAKQVMKEYKNPWLPDFPIDYCDSDSQVQLLKHHYLNEFDHYHIREVMKDYSPNAVIYEVLDQTPKTYRGKRGVRNMCRDVLGKVKNIELEHIAVNHNHAQVIWKGETASHAKIVGTDSFTFDENNHITSQTIVALTKAGN